MNKKITQTVKKYNMLSNGDTVLVGCSGGADSMLLLSYLLSVKDEYSLTIKVAHIEHGIRGQASLDDACFVEYFCNDNNIEFNLLSINAVDESKAQSMSVEEYSRKKRYEFFNSIACDKIATAHNLSDNVETLLMRLGRGTGLKGACCIPPVRDKIIRPLIELSSDEIRQYCDSNNIAYRVDLTNFENDYTRNRIRNIILPAYKELYPDLEQALAGFIQNANEDYSFINSVADDLLNKAINDNMLDITILRDKHIAIQKRVVAAYFSSLGITLDKIHLNEIVKLINKIGKIQIMGNIYAISNDKYIRVADLEQKDFNSDYVTEILNISEFIKDNVDFYCDYDKIVGNVIVRARLVGDCIKPSNRNCTKSLKKLYNEYSVPLEDRDTLPVICDDNGVIGVVGLAVDERVKLTANSKKILTIKFPSED